MADLGDIGAILEDEPVSDLDWLDVDEDEYRATEALPKQNLDAVPELEAQWKDLTEADKYRLSPENREPANARTPFWSERSIPGEISGDDAVAIVEKFAKRHVQAGVSGPDVIQILKSNFDAEVLSMSKKAVRGVLSERGLLGSVYIDSELFEDCYKGGPQKGLTANTRNAKYVLAKSQCGDCILNRKGRCSVFQKEIVLEVDYTKDLWEEYLDGIHMERKDLDGIQNLPVKARLQKALLASPIPESDALDGKPIVPDPTAGVTYEDAMDQLRSADIKREIVANTVNRKKVLRLAVDMMRGNHGPAVRDLLASDPAVASLKDELYVLGQLYLDLSYFPTYKVASQFIDLFEKQGAADNLPPLIVGIPFEESELDKRYAHAPSLDIRSDKALLHTISRFFLTKQGRKLDNTKKALFKKLFARLKKSDEADVRAFAQKVYKKPVPKEVSKYQATVIYDPTHGISSEQADSQLRKADRKRVVVENPTKISNTKDLVGRMLRGDHGNKVATLIKQDDRLSKLSKHLHLLGRLYVDTSLATPREVEAAAAANPAVRELPLLTPNNRKGFFKKPEVHALIAKRVAKIKGIDTDPAYTQTLRNVVSRLSQTSEGKVMAFARKAFSMPVKGKAAVHNTPYQINPQVEVSDEQVNDFMDSLKSKKQARAFETLEDYLKEEGGAHLLASLQKRIGLDRIKRLYMQNDGKVASNLDTSKTAKSDALEILSAVLDDNYKPNGLKPPSRRMARTKMGKWLRDQMMKGKYGSALADALKLAFPYTDLLEDAPVIIAFREEEGLYGRAYSTADSYDSCNEGTQDISASVQQIVKGSKCQGCIYNKIGRCLLYSKKLVDDPVYTDETVNAALQYRVSNGQLTERDAKRIRMMDVDPRTKTRIAYTSEPANEVQMHETGLQAFYGDQSEKQVNHAAVREIVEKKKAAEKKALEQIDTPSEGGIDGKDQMSEFELGGVASDGSINEIEFHGGPSPTLDVEFGDGFNIE
jgi:hypothetical protein